MPPKIIHRAGDRSVVNASSSTAAEHEDEDSCEEGGDGRGESIPGVDARDSLESPPRTRRQAIQLESVSRNAAMQRAKRRDNGIVRECGLRGWRKCSQRVMRLA